MKFVGKNMSEVVSEFFFSEFLRQIVRGIVYVEWSGVCC